MERTYDSVPEMFAEVMLTVRMFGVREHTRNGEVWSIQEPLLVKLRNPRQRILNDKIRLANPFFHVMEFVWMMAGSNDVEWIAQYNKQMMSYAEDDGKMHAAYGHRWAKAFGIDQVPMIIRRLRADNFDRRCVLGIWSPQFDLDIDTKDIPCNTHIYFRVVGGKLNMLVCNRSNDVVWGMTGANAVHMTMLHELIATAAEIELGEYHVLSNNAHVYCKLPNVDRMLNTPWVKHIHLPTEAILSPNERYYDFVNECRKFIHEEDSKPKCWWLLHVAKPMKDIYLARKKHQETRWKLDERLDEGWRDAAKKWLAWKSQ